MSTLVVPWRISPPSKAAARRSNRTPTVLHAENASNRMRSPLAVQIGSRMPEGVGWKYRVWATSASTSRPRASTSGWAANPEKNSGASVSPSGVRAGANSRVRPVLSRAEAEVNDLMVEPYRAALTKIAGSGGCAPARIVCRGSPGVSK